MDDSEAEIRFWPGIDLQDSSRPAEMGIMSVLDQLKRVTLEKYPQNQVIFKEGETSGDSMYFVFEGIIGIFRGEGSEERQINSIGPGKFFGEMALIRAQPRMATARVVSPEAKVGVINKSILYKLSGSSPQFLFYLLRHAVDRLIKSEDTLQKITEELDQEKGRRGIS
ncbi:MAG: cyclic nucleotide-binding domain-containing protein [Leptospiraceae bacterium]|nr:cyclic nucleotide-binding domain-containing protein [Leptospiraceae bacterium]